jgi:hypothetical protein
VRKIVFTRPKKIVYADQIARQRKQAATLLSVSKPERPLMLDDIAYDLRARRGHSGHQERALVRWLAECGVVQTALSLESAIVEMRTAPRDKLVAIAAALRG